ncbi:MAG: O-antigen ligase family protein [Chloroflexi bacterium]|nr:O-antigen ligase family protein [Chloroflexota bacterium]
MPAPAQSPIANLRSLLSHYWDTPFFVELLLLILTAPVLYFPGRFQAQEIAFAIGILAAGWLWRRLTIGVWFRRTPADWSIFFLFAVMLPVSVWAAPEPLREQYAIPRALILVWNFFLFWTIVSHASRRRELFHLCVAGFGGIGVGIAVAALFGTQWTNKFPVIGPLLDKLPKPLLGVFVGAEDGFSPNQLAGTLLYILPLLIALTVYGVSRKRTAWISWLPAGLAAGIIGLVLLLSQSRGALLGLAVGLGCMLLINWRWGRWLLLAGSLAALIGLAVVPLDSLSSSLETAENVQEVAGSLTLEGRIEIWSRALYGIQDFSFTGMGLGSFRRIVNLLYPLFTIAPDYDIAHAHNFFLQMALDFGIPGLIALLVLYMMAGAATASLWKKSDRVWAIGLLGVLVAQTVYSMADAVALGSKVNFLFWWLFALIFALGRVRGESSTSTAV